MKSGVIVLHIHPYLLGTDPTDNSKHQSEEEILTLDMTYFQSYSSPKIQAIEKPIELLLAVILTEPNSYNPPVNDTHPLFLRGPPSSLFI